MRTEKNKIAVFLSLILLLSVLMSAVGCNGSTPPDEDKDPPSDTIVNIFKDGKTDYSIAYSDDVVAHEKYANEIFKCIALDFMYDGFEKYEYNEEHYEKEILIGATDRAASRQLVEAVNAANTGGGDLAWGYGVKDGDLAFYANCDAAFAYGWGAFYDTVVHDDGIYCDSDLWVIGRKSYDEYIAENGLLFEGKTVSFFGDSITSYKGYSSAGNAIYYGSGNAAYLNVNDTYWMKLIDNYGMKLGVNDGWSGSRIGWDGKTEVANMVGDGIYMASQARIDALDNNGTPDQIIVYAGTNDMRREPLGSINDVDWETVLNYKSATPEERARWAVNDFAHATASMLAGLKMTYPNAHIVVLIPTWIEIDTSREHMKDAAAVQKTVKEFGDLYIEVCKKFGIDYIDLRTLIAFEDRESSGFFGDAPTYLHPSSKGMQMIFEELEKYYDRLMAQELEKLKQE